MIYIIITTSIINIIRICDENVRKQRYINSIKQTLQLLENEPAIKPIIVENNGFRPTYLDDLNCDVFYTNNNTMDYLHKGKGVAINELLDIKDVIIPTYI